MKEIIKKLKSESEIDENSKNQFNYDYSLLPENVLIKIFKHLTSREILNASECCRRWQFVSRDSMLWKAKFREDFKVDKEIKIKPSKLKLDLRKLCNES